MDKRLYAKYCVNIRIIVSIFFFFLSRHSQDFNEDIKILQKHTKSRNFPHDKGPVIPLLESTIDLISVLIYKKNTKIATILASLIPR